MIRQGCLVNKNRHYFVSNSEPLSINTLPDHVLVVTLNILEKLTTNGIEVDIVMQLSVSHRLEFQLLSIQSDEHLVLFSVRTNFRAEG
jgi:hypothetical protein